MRKILKFDSGKKGFERAAYTLVVGAIIMIIFGIYFLWGLFK